MQIIIDAKVNEYTDKKGKFHPSFPREDNLATIKDGRASRKTNIIEREAEPIRHPAQQVHGAAEGPPQTPAEVWTGSTNISDGRHSPGRPTSATGSANADVARAVQGLLGAARSRSRAAKGRRPRDRAKKKKALPRPRSRRLGDRADVTGNDPERRHAGLQSALTRSRCWTSTSSWSTRPTRLACITLAFGVSEDVQGRCSRTTPTENHIVFLLLEKEDKPERRAARSRSSRSTRRNNVYKAWGAFLRIRSTSGCGRPTRARCSSTST